MNPIKQLVMANRILAREEVVDAYGHVSLRHPEHPDRFLLAVSQAPELIEPDDILEFDLEARPLAKDARPLYVERFIHAAIYEARPDVMAVVHACRGCPAVLRHRRAVAPGDPFRRSLLDDSA